MTVKKLRNEASFIEFVSTKRRLLFGNDAVVNPCFGAKITTVFDIKNAYPNLNAIYVAQMKSLSGKLNDPSSKVCSLDLYMPEDYKDPDKHVIRLHQVARLCSTIRSWMGAN